MFTEMWIKRFAGQKGAEGVKCDCKVMRSEVPRPGDWDLLKGSQVNLSVD